MCLSFPLTHSLLKSPVLDHLGGDRARTEKLHFPAREGQGPARARGLRPAHAATSANVYLASTLLGPHYAAQVEVVNF